MLGRGAIAGAIQRRKTIADLVDELARMISLLRNAADFLTVRPAKAAARGTALEEISVLVPEKERHWSNWKTNSTESAMRACFVTTQVCADGL